MRVVVHSVYKCVVVAAQIMTDTVGNPEYERSADFYQQPWMSEAVNRYFYNKVSPTAPRYTASLQAPRYYQGAYVYL